jgi:hypothetical protein
MTLAKKDAPKNFISSFMIWIALCNIVAIILAILWYVYFPESFRFDATISMIIVIVINVLSIILLYPLPKRDPLTPFLKSAIIWFIVISIIYVVLGAYFALIPGTIQFFGDLLFHWKLNKLENDFKLS